MIFLCAYPKYLLSQRHGGLHGNEKNYVFSTRNATGARVVLLLLRGLASRRGFNRFDTLAIKLAACFA